MELVVFLSFIFLCCSAFASDCSITPLYIDIHDRQVDGDSLDQYGAFIGIGSPAQNQSLWPSLSHNETTFASPEYCSAGSSSPASCNRSTHGIFDPSQSTSWISTPQYHSLDFSLPASSEYGTDTLRLRVHYFNPSPAAETNLTSYPITLLSNSTNQTSYFSPAGLVSLSSHSTLLTHLSTQNLISTPSFGLYLGSAYPRAGGTANGSLTLGGYDAGRFENPVHSFNLSAQPNEVASPFKVTVSSMTLRSLASNATDVLLDSTSESPGFDAYITTVQYGLTLPSSIVRGFQALASAESTIDENGESVFRTSPTSDYLQTHNLTLTLSNGLTVSFPPSWLVHPSSGLTPISSTPLTSNSSADDEGESPFLLGASFLSTLYLVSTPQSSQFHLAPALPDAPYIYTRPLCSGDASAIPTPVSNASHSVSSFAAQGLIGAVLGGIIGGIALVMLGVCWFRQWQKTRANAERTEKKPRRVVVLGKGILKRKSVRFASDKDKVSFKTYKNESGEDGLGEWEMGGMHGSDYRQEGDAYAVGIAR